MGIVCRSQFPQKRAWVYCSCSYKENHRRVLLIIKASTSLENPISTQPLVWCLHVGPSSRLLLGGSARCEPKTCREGGWSLIILGLMEKRMEASMVCWGYLGRMEKKMETTMVYWSYTGIVKKKMETTMVYSGYIWIMEKKMDPTIYDYANSEP